MASTCRASDYKDINPVFVKTPEVVDAGHAAWGMKGKPEPSVNKTRTKPGELLATTHLQHSIPSLYLGRLLSLEGQTLLVVC